MTLLKVPVIIFCPKGMYDAMYQMRAIHCTKTPAADTSSGTALHFSGAIELYIVLLACSQCGELT